MPQGTLRPSLASSATEAPRRIISPGVSRPAASWTTPPSDSAYIPMTVTEGWISFIDATTAQRTSATDAG